MLKTSRCRLVFLAGVILFGNSVKCLCQEGDSRWLVWTKLLEHAGLETVWKYELPMIENEKLERMLIADDFICALSNRNYLYVLSRQNGKLVFDRSLAPPGFTVSGLKLYKDELISTVGNKLVEISAESGAALYNKDMGFGVSCLAARNSSFFYLAGADKRLRCLRSNDKVKLFEVAAENESLITSVIADDASVIFATDVGNVISIAPDRPKKKWQFMAGDGIAGAIVRDGDFLFVASKDTYVYKLSVGTGLPVWKYQCPAILNKAPLVTSKFVYQYVNNKGLTAIDKKSGEFVWLVKQGIDLLAEADGKAYVMKKPGQLVVMNNRKAKKLYSVNFARVSRFAANQEDAKIYIGDERGRIVCLKPAE